MFVKSISLSNPDRIPFWKTELISPGINCVRQPGITSLKETLAFIFCGLKKFLACWIALKVN
ncbi:hypothetical protein CHE29_13160 [Salmonella enterica]|nr:hypothetical protein CHE29_13160 [Salmonella enterica]